MAETIKQGLTSLDIANDRKEQLIAALKEICPEAVAENHVDIDTLRRTLGEAVDAPKERFGLNWHGKADCMKAVQHKSIASLQPKREESVEFDTTQNLIIEGDNLEVLKLLQNSYYNKVKMIYIDPPYNTGKEFIYPDKFAENLETYLAYTGQIDDEGRKFSTNSDKNGRYHANWLNMMYPRLFLARNLLRDDGIFVTHIDEHESIHFQLILDEIFGSENNLGNIIWDKKNPKGDATKIAIQHETILIYAKSAEIFKVSNPLKRTKENAERMLNKAKTFYSKLGNKNISIKDVNDSYQSWLKMQCVSGGEAAYKFIDINGNVFQPVSMAWPNKQKAPDDYFEPLIHPKSKKSCPVPDRGWRNPLSTMQELLKNKLIIFGDDETTQPRRKYLLKENMEENIPSILPYGGSDDALLAEFDLPFENPKPVKLSKLLLKYFSNNDDIILDFFAGSGTTAHAVMELNKEDGGNRKFILVQLPEPTDENSEAHKADYKTIAEITRERVRRAGKKIINDANGQLALRETPLDVGFKAFSLARSNFKIWDETGANFSQKQLEMHLNPLVETAAPEAVLYELILKEGYTLTAPLRTLTLAGKQVHCVDNTLYICLEKDLTLDMIHAIAALAPHKVLCLDEGFHQNDALLTNAVLIFKAKAKEIEREIIFKTI